MPPDHKDNHTLVAGDLSGKEATVEDYQKAMSIPENTWQERQKSEAWKLTGHLLSIPVIFDFTGEVHIAEKGKALMVDVLKTNQLDLASKQLHLTIAYHQAQDLPDRIVETTKR